MNRKFRNIIGTVLFIAALSGCKDKNISIPPNVFAKDTAVMVFSELHIMEALMIQGSLTPKDSIKNIDAYREGILQKFNLSPERLDESYNFYISHPELLDKVYVEVLNELSQRKAEAEN